MGGGAVIGRLGLLLRLGVEEMMVPATNIAFVICILYTKYVVMLGKE